MPYLKLFLKVVGWIFIAVNDFVSLHGKNITKTKQQILFLSKISILIFIYFIFTSFLVDLQESGCCSLNNNTPFAFKAIVPSLLLYLALGIGYTGFKFSIREDEKNN